MPTPEADARRAREITDAMKQMTADQDALTAERERLMVSLHDAGWNNVQIAEATGLTRARVSTILKPILDARQPAVVNGG